MNLLRILNNIQITLLKKTLTAIGKPICKKYCNNRGQCPFLLSSHCKIAQKLDDLDKMYLEDYELKSMDELIEAVNKEQTKWSLILKKLEM